MKNKKQKTKKPQTHHEDDESIIREIEEAVKKEQYAKFAKKHAPLVAMVVLLMAGALVAGKAWKDKQHEAAKAAGQKIYTALNDKSFDAALLDKSQASADIKQFAEITKARLLAVSGKEDEAAKLYQQIANNKNYDDALRELAALNRASLQMNSGINTKELKISLEQIASNGKAFKYSAQELLAAYELQFGKPENAKKIFEKLIADKNTPSGIMMRAKQINANI